MSSTAPGITLTEIDNTGLVIDAQPSGRAAGVIGTANQGTAFVPITVANNDQLETEFGYGDALVNAPLAMNRWLTNANAGTYVRVLGAGDGNARTTTGNNTGKVNNAGFVVGSREIQTSSGQFANNPYATAGGIEGRTYFLGCYMSESAGSYVLSEAGIQTSAAAQPIIRGVIFAASGVQITVSSSAPGQSSDTYSAAATTASPAKGWFTGSVNLIDTNQTFVLFLNGHNNTGFGSIITASFNPTAGNYLANALNTNPSLFEEYGHVLYAHYPVLDGYAAPTGSGVAAEALIRRVSTATEIEEIVFCLTGSQARNNGTSVFPNYDGFEDRYTHPMTPFIASQNFGSTRYDLFKIHARSDGAYANELYKIGVKNITYPSAGAYAKFTVDIRKWDDTDIDQKIYASYENCDLDPDSANFIGKKIGDLNTYFDFDRSIDAQKVVEEGLYGKVSRRVWVEVSDAVANKLVPTNTVPVASRGYYHLVTSGSGFLSTGSANNSSHLNVPITNAREMPIQFRKSINVSGAPGASTATAESKFSWGPQFELANSVTQPNDGTTVVKNQMSAYTKYFPKYHTVYQNPWVGDNAGAAMVNGSVVDADLFNKSLFTLENIQIQTGSDGLPDSTRWDEAIYQRDGVLDTTLGGRFLDITTDFLATNANQYLKHISFMQGGFDGTSLVNQDRRYMRDAAIRRELDNTNQGELSGPTVAAYRKAIDILSNKTYSDISLLAIPDIRHPAVTDYALNAMQTKFDALYIMDVELKDGNNNYVTASIAASEYPSINISNTTARFKNRGLNNSFGAAYFPDLMVSVYRPGSSVSVSTRLPASTMVLGAYAQNDAQAFTWTAPAGSNRALIPAESLSTLLLSDNIDPIYNSGINPLITNNGSTFINGQRTLLIEGSALDRVNVRRLLIEVRRRVKAVAYTLLFEPSRESTIARFNAAVTPIMKQVQAQRGVERYRVQIDATTTTQADIENNTIRGKIYLQPTKAVEFVSIDFVATNAAFF
jgi:hypothetical protein